jgi:excisionase family DNA binding protein
MTKSNTKNTFKSYPDALTLKELAKMLGISQKLASRLIRNGEIKAIKVGREYRIAKVNAIKFLLGEQSKEKCVQSETSNPKDWTCGNLCGMVVDTEKTPKKEVS